MHATELSLPSVDAVLSSEDATRQVAAEIAGMLRPGDVVALKGDLGSGKTTFARALIRQLAGDARLEVPSPSFTLVQTYDLPAFPLAHVDLYRIGSPGELTELGLSEVFESGVTLVEWPERAEGRLPRPRIEVALALAPDLGPDRRRLKIVSAAPLPPDLTRFLAFYRFMQEAGCEEAQRIRLQGDASTRIYERLTIGAGSAILMIAPRRPDGPPVRDGRSYSALAHLAEDVTPFVAMARALRERGFSAPEIYAADLSEGLLVIEDLGAEGVVAGDPPVIDEERYSAAVEALATLHRQQLPDELPVSPSVTYRIPRYDMDAFLIEAELLLDWYLPQQDREVSSDIREEFLALWRATLEPAFAASPTWVLRDYHSPNLLWLPQREGVARVGLLDFQDVLMGPAAYDVTSLLQDARVDVSATFEDIQIGRYMKGRRSDRDFDPVKFVELYALMGAQRATKILGIFARLEKRDGKPQYLRHQPRVWRNLRRSLSHPTLAGLKGWYDAHVPAPRFP